jgi:hypothetical protein
VVGEPSRAPKGVPFSARLAFRPIASFSFGAIDHVTTPFCNATNAHDLHFDVAPFVDQIYFECFSRRIHSPMQQAPVGS